MNILFSEIVGAFYLSGISIQKTFSDADFSNELTCYGDILLSFQNVKNDSVFFRLSLSVDIDNNNKLHLSKFNYPYKKPISMDERKRDLAIQREELCLDSFYNNISFSKQYLVEKIDFFGCTSDGKAVSIDFFDFHFTNGKTVHFRINEKAFTYKLFDTIDFNWKEKSNYISLNGMEKDIKLLHSFGAK